MAWPDWTKSNHIRWNFLFFLLYLKLKCFWNDFNTLFYETRYVKKRQKYDQLSFDHKIRSLWQNNRNLIENYWIYVVVVSFHTFSSSHMIKAKQTNTEKGQISEMVWPNQVLSQQICIKFFTNIDRHWRKSGNSISIGIFVKIIFCNFIKIKEIRLSSLLCLSWHSQTTCLILYNQKMVNERMLFMYLILVKIIGSSVNE